MLESDDINLNLFIDSLEINEGDIIEFVKRKPDIDSHIIMKPFLNHFKEINQTYFYFDTLSKIKDAKKDNYFNNIMDFETVFETINDINKNNYNSIIIISDFYSLMPIRSLEDGSKYTIDGIIHSYKSNLIKIKNDLIKNNNILVITNTGYESMQVIYGETFKKYYSQLINPFLDHEIQVNSRKSDNPKVSVNFRLKYGKISKQGNTIDIPSAYSDEYRAWSLFDFALKIGAFECRGRSYIYKGYQTLTLNGTIIENGDKITNKKLNLIDYLNNDKIFYQAITKELNQLRKHMELIEDKGIDAAYKIINRSSNKNNFLKSLSN